MELFVSSKANTQCVWLLCGDILYNLSILFSKLDLFIEKASIGEWHIGLNSWECIYTKPELNLDDLVFVSKCG